MSVQSLKCKIFSGNAAVPGDKSISHRALMLASQAKGVSRISGLLEGEDVLATAEGLRKLGVKVTRVGEGDWEVEGVGIGGFLPPVAQLDMGNAGTGSRLMMGLVSTYPFDTSFTGDASLCSRPMQRIVTPLERMGVKVTSSEGCRLPLTVHGTEHAKAICYELPVASAQVKSAILLAGLNIEGATQVIEPVPTRDHTERMLKGMGADIQSRERPEGGYVITLQGRPQLKAQNFNVPADPSSAAFLVVAALIAPNSEITVRNVCLNPSRTGLYTSLKEMGADINFVEERQVAGEPVADLVVKSSRLQGITVPPERAPSMIDEYPVLSVAAACAEGETVMEGLEELKVKESDRLQAIADGLRANGVKFQQGESSLRVTGGVVPGGGMVKTHLDHRIAMSFLVLGMAAQKEVGVDDANMIDTSFPGFTTLMNKLGADIR